MITQQLSSFNAGELSPLIHLRSDLEKYRNGCRTLENMLVTPYGGAQKRAGLSYTATCSGKARLFPFQAAIDKGFILEFTDLSLRFFKRDAPVQSGGADYTLVTPYTSRDLSKLSLRQINNIAYLVHPNYPVYKLTRFADANWSLAEVAFAHPPMLPENVDTARSITTVTGGEAGSTISLTSSFSLFTQDHVGGYFQLRHPRDPDEYEIKLAATSANNNGYSTELTVQGTVSFRTQGTWNGTFVIEVNRGSSWVELARYSSSSDANYSAEFEEDARARMRLKWEHVGNGSSSPAAFLEAVGPYVQGLVKITAVTSSSTAAALVVKGVEQGATTLWREGAFSPVQGYPRTVCTHEQRVCFGGTESYPQTIWASAVDDYENFEPGVNDDDSWSHTIVSGQQNHIQWMESQRALLIGTTGDEWVLSSSKDETIITPTNVRARRHSRNGSDLVPPITVDNATIFAQRGGRVVREMTYSFEADGYQTTELTLLAEHITGTGIKEMAWQTQPDQVLWCVTKDGKLISMTYDKGQNVVGWARHTTGASGTFESVAVRQADGEDDQIWVVVKRTINGSQVRYVERLKPDGFFLEEPWSLQYQDTYGLEPWTLYQLPTTEDGWQLIDNQWSYGDVVFKRVSATTGDEDWDAVYADDYPSGALVQSVYFCAVPHDTDSSSDWYVSNNDLRPRLLSLSDASPTGHWYTLISWQATGTGNAYSVNTTIPDYVYNSATGKIYYCILNHTSAATDEPGVGVNWATYWAEFADYPTPTHYSPSSPIYEIGGDDIQYNGSVWTIAQDRPARSNNAPASGVAEWTENFQTYALNDEVVHNAVPYRCISGHTAATTNEPGVGASWATYWEVIQDDYTAGDLVSSDGVNYRCTVTHTPSSATEPGVGASWATVWEVLTDEESIQFFVDSGVTLINPGVITEVTGLSHLEGETVQISANGAVLKERTVSSGAIQLDQEGDPATYTDISVGLGYTATLEPMALEIGMQNGTSTSREKQIHELVIYFQASYGAKVGTEAAGSFDKIAFHNASIGEPVTLFTGPKVHKLEDRHSLDATFIVKQDLPMPCHILCIIPKFNAYGDN